MLMFFPMILPAIICNAGISEKIPVILDTDIGTDIDDTWALAMMLNSPELDVKLVVTDTGNTTYRAKIVAKMLEVAGRTDVPVGVGIHLSDKEDGQADWVKNYDLSSYPGKVYKDGVGALIDTIMNSPKPVTLICIGPVPNIGKALELEPKIAQKAKFVGMHGSVRKGYGGSDKVSAEYNVVAYPKDCQKAFTAPWDMTITPLDTCGLVVLQGEKYKKVAESKTSIAKAVIENYNIWAKGTPDKSSVLFDTVAIYLAFSEKLLVMEKLGIRVTDDGYTVLVPPSNGRTDEDKDAKVINCALDWKDLSAFEDFLVERIIK